MEGSLEEDLMKEEMVEEKIMLRNNENEEFPNPEYLMKVEMVEEKIMPGNNENEEFRNPEEICSKKGYIKKEKTLSCSEPGCAAMFNRPFCLRRHIEIVHDKQKPHACTESGCNEAFGQRQQLEEHGRSSHGHPWLACQVEGCKATFLLLGALRYHRMAVHKDQPYVCQEPNCNKIFSDKKLLDAHGRSQHSKPKLACKVAGCVVSFCSLQGLFYHMRAVHNKTTPYVCLVSDCDKKFPTRIRLDEHSRSNHGHSKLVCGVGGCTASFCSQSGLREHKAKEGNAHHRYKENDKEDTDWTPGKVKSKHKPKKSRSGIMVTKPVGRNEQDENNCETYKDKMVLKKAYVPTGKPRGRPRKNCQDKLSMVKKAYVPTGKPRGRPRKNCQDKLSDTRTIKCDQCKQEFPANVDKTVLVHHIKTTHIVKRPECRELTGQEDRMPPEAFEPTHNL